MKKRSFILLTAAVSSFVMAQQTTLQHFDPTVITPIVEEYEDGDGYLSGINAYGDEEFGEKYEIQGTGKLFGVSAIHVGQDGTAGSVMAAYRAYNVAGSGLPGAQIANYNLSYADVPVDGSLKSIQFANPVNISGNFFVSFRLGDYSHGGLGTKTLALTYAPDGTRTQSDLANYGRNVVRWHSHGATPTWKDFRTENLENYQPAIHFAIFPIVELDDMAVVDFNQKGNIGAVYPNPSNGTFRIPVKSNTGGESTFKLFDMSGKLVAEKSAKLSSGNSEFVFAEEKLQKGLYILWIKTPEGAVSQKVSIK